MKSIILAAGRGSRMKGWTQESPKTMLELDGKSILQHQVDAQLKAGITEISVVTGYLKDAIQAKGITHRFENPRWAETNMVRSLMVADSWLSAESCLVSYGDIFYAPTAPQALIECQADIAITYDVHFWELWSRRFADPMTDLENFRIDAAGRITDIGGRAQKREDIQGQYMGLLKFTPAGWSKTVGFLKSQLPEAVDKMDMTTLLRSLIAQGVAVQGVAYADGWGEVDVPDDLALYEKEQQIAG